MEDRELKSLSQQLAYCHSTNKRLSQPLNLYFTGVGPRLKAMMEHQNCQNWAVDIRYNESSQIPKPEESCYLGYPEELPKDRLVYLSADSENLITTLDPGNIYLIGGLVDHNRHKLVTFNKAKAQGIAHGRLPIRECGVKLTTSCVLTVNHVVDIIAKYLELSNYG
jgi:tRNA (guanine9-N1)-methyltransferase